MIPGCITRAIGYKPTIHFSFFLKITGRLFASGAAAAPQHGMLRSHWASSDTDIRGTSESLQKRLSHTSRHLVYVQWKSRDGSALTCSGCRNKMAHTRVAQTTEMSVLIVLEARSPKSRFWQFLFVFPEASVRGLLMVISPCPHMVFLLWALIPGVL